MPEDHLISESIAEAYTLLPSEIDFISRKMGVNRMAQALLLKYFQEHSRFPEKLEDIPPEAILWVSEQLADSSDLIHEFDW